MTSRSQSLMAISCGCVVVVSTLFVPGCGGSSPPQGNGAGYVAWDRFKEINPKADIEKAQANYGIWRDDGLAFLILADFVGSSRDRSSAKGTGAEKYAGQHKASARQRVEWECETTDGKTGKMIINGSSFELAKGALFLVSTQGGKVEVRQFQRDLLKVKPDQESLERLLKDDPDVGSFFADQPKPK